MVRGRCGEVLFRSERNFKLGAEKREGQNLKKKKVEERGEEFSDLESAPPLELFTCIPRSRLV